MNISKYTKLGILIVISITILIWGLSYLKGNDIFQKSNDYHVIYERVDGLSKSNDVILSGYKIGQVKNIAFTQGNRSYLRVTFTIDSDIKIPVNSVAQIVSSDLMGTRSIKLNMTDENEFYQPNDTIPGDIESDLKEQVSMQVLPIKNKAEELLSTIDSAITILTVIFNEDARQNLSESFENINRTIENLEQTTSDLQVFVSTEKESVGNIITNMDSITTAFNRNTAELEKTLQNIAQFSDTLAQMPITPVLTNILEASNKINSVLAKLESTDNSAGLLLNDDELYASITTLSADLSSLIRDIRINPERYLQFSAIDLGKNVYINASGDAAEENIVFKVHLVSSENKIPLDADHFKGLGPIEEYEASGAYSYLAGESHSYAEIAELHVKATDKFPDATIVAFKNGRLIKLEKALKSLKK
ncbi:phospholipid/cholesterol/gamma-HCH transport system substrate-binding protein [Tangfeifania diversioriginum]|uniref:Phospholipid/cholesterol/gamma-HCH transport system substrate-binding protein n=1 Tax=Tangfeifania diversioriginum TaxID=1168035 RepID=A0A1M6K4K2_9BACT|nr:MlaD family protein [Tangfeifania diversioriginum]SHJ53886.1 phospholipid/cholesterol/gamma-HCH transport system substrate-binding protein [Tangfeifania diversioriginum]